MTFTHIALALLVAITQRSQPATATPEPVVIKIVPATAQQAQHAEWALARFEAAGLELPPLTIVFHDDYQSCGMREGVLRIVGENVTIHECQNDPSRSQRSLLHELAHTWDHVAGSIDTDTRTDFLRLRDLQSWDDDELPWNQRGEEQAAEIIAWGLMHQPAPIPTSVGDRGPQDTLSLTTSFTLLTGIRPLFGDTEFRGRDPKAPTATTVFARRSFRYSSYRTGRVADLAVCAVSAP